MESNISPIRVRWSVYMLVPFFCIPPEKNGETILLHLPKVIRKKGDQIIENTITHGDFWLLLRVDVQTSKKSSVIPYMDPMEYQKII